MPAAIALATLGGAAHAAGFPPLGWSVTPWVALAPLLIASASLSPARAAVAGLCWTAAAAVGVVGFLPGMLSGYFGLAPATSWVAALSIVGALHGSYIAAYAAWVAWLARRRAAHPLLLASGWVACELARAHGELGSPWALAAYSQANATTLIQIADLAGPYGLGFVIAAVNACVAAALAPGLRGRRLPFSALATAGAMVAVVGYGQWRLQETFSDGDAVRVAVVQAGAPTRDPALRAERLVRHASLSMAHGTAADLIVWPEHAVDEYLQEASPARAAVLDVARATGADLLAGGPHHERAAEGTRYHNSAHLVRAGVFAARYDKHRLVPFAEDGRVGGGGGVAARYTPGTGEPVLPARLLRAGVLICVEAMFPDLARGAVAAGAEVLVNLSNDAWFGRPEAAQQQLDIATLRAVESRRYLVRAAATGISAVIDPHGRTLRRSGFGTHEVLAATVHRSSTRTPYQRWGDALAWLVIAAAALASLAATLRSTPTVKEERNVR